MENPLRHTALANWLKNLLQEGILISHEITAFTEATFGTTDLSALLNDTSSDELDSLMELIFFPDLHTQMRFEHQWGDSAFTSADVGWIIDHLSVSPLRVPLADSASGGRPLIIEAPDYAIDAFVRRLNITYQPNARLVQVLQDHYHGDQRLVLRVRLRNARLKWTGEQIELLRGFLSAMPASRLDVDDLLVFLVSLMDDLVPGIDPFEFLVGKKRFFFQSLCKAEDFERQRQASNMETMMLKGARSAHGSIAEWRQWMRKVDQVCQAIFGRTQFFQQPAEQDIDIHNKNSKETMQDVMRVLS